MSKKPRIVLTLYRHDPAIEGSDVRLADQLPCINEAAAWMQAEQMLGKNRIFGARIMRVSVGDKDIEKAECLATLGKVRIGISLQREALA